MLEVERNKVYKTEICKDCGKFFKITNGEKEFYDSKGWVLPIRCKDCRRKRKMQAKGDDAK
jgi:RNase P subunit RPR2